MNNIEKVINLVADHLGLEAQDITPASNIKEDLGADSLDMVELVMKLEEEFGLKIAEEELQKITTIQEIADYIAQQA